MAGLRSIPARKAGGSPFGWHFLSHWKACETFWFNTYLRPHPKGGVGVSSTKTGAALLIGGACHRGLEAWYRSGWRDGEDTGEYSLDTMIEAGTQELTDRKDEFSEEKGQHFDEALVLVTSLLEKYHYHMGPGGIDQDFPSYKVAGDDQGEPLIEREFWLDLGYRDYTFTARLDLLMWVEGYLEVREHKTTAASRCGMLIRQLALDGQITGQNMLLAAMYPDVPRKGVEANILVKDRGAKSNLPPFPRQLYGNTPIELEKFKNDTIAALKNIDEHVYRYEELIQKGMSVSEAALAVFDASPPAIQCVGFYECDFYRPCKMKGYEESLFATSFKPRSTGLLNPLNTEEKTNATG